MQKASELRGWPTVGETYLVPHVLWPRHEMPRDPWVPIYGEKHTDFEDDEIEHVHVDPRFITAEQEETFATFWRSYEQFHHLLTLRKSKHSDGIKGALGFAPPVHPTFVPKWLPRVCRYERIKWDVSGAGDADYHASEDDLIAAKRFMAKVREGRSIKAKVSDGRPLCPHQGFDLTAVWDGKSKTVRCPLHGMKVDVSRCQQRRRGVSGPVSPSLALPALP